MLRKLLKEIAMYDLIEVRKNDLFTNSKVIAEGTENQHESIVATIRKYENDSLDFGQIDFSDLKSGKRGQPEKVYYLNEGLPSALFQVWGGFLIWFGSVLLLPRKKSLPGIVPEAPRKRITAPAPQSQSTDYRRCWP